MDCFLFWHNVALSHILCSVQVKMTHCIRKDTCSVKMDSIFSFLWKFIGKVNKIRKYFYKKIECQIEPNVNSAYYASYYYYLKKKMKWCFQFDGDPWPDAAECSKFWVVPPDSSAVWWVYVLSGGAPRGNCHRRDTHRSHGRGETGEVSSRKQNTCWNIQPKLRPWNIQWNILSNICNDSDGQTMVWAIF